MGLAILGCFVYATVDLAQDGPLAVALQSFLTWLSAGGFVAAAAFAAVYGVAVVVMIPELVLWLGGGYAFAAAHGPVAGPVIATVAVMTGQFAGNATAFLLGRLLLGDCLAPIAARYPLARALDLALRYDGFRILLLLRLSPLTPNQLLNWLLAGTSIPLLPYLAATIAMAPVVALFCALGGVITTLAEATHGQGGESPGVTIALTAVGAVATIAAIALLTYYTRQKLRVALAASAAAAGVSVASIEGSATGPEEDSSALGSGAAADSWQQPLPPCRESDALQPMDGTNSTASAAYR